MKRKIIAAILLLVLAPLAVAAPYIQDSSIMSCAQLVAAGGTCANLPNATKIWSPTLNETIESAIIDGDLAGSFAANLHDGSFKVSSSADFTKLFKVNLTAPATGTTTTVFFRQTLNRSVTIPDADTTLVGQDTTDTLFNKTLGTTGMIGFLTLVGDPVSALQAATKQYVDNTVAAAPYISTTLPNGKILIGSVTNVATAVTPFGDVTISVNGAITIAANAVLNSKLAQMPANTLKGNNTGGAIDPLDLTPTQVTAMLNNFVGDSGAGGTKGLVPAPAAGDAAAGKFLKADGTFAVPTATAASATFETFSQVGGTTPIDNVDGVRVVDQSRTISNVICGMRNSGGVTTSASSTFIEFDYGPTLNRAVTLPIVGNYTFNYSTTVPAFTAVNAGDFESLKVLSVSQGAPEDLSCKIVY